MGVSDVSAENGDDTIVIDVVTGAAPTPTSRWEASWTKLQSQAYILAVEPWTRLSAGDVSGSLGDLGTFLPLTVRLPRPI